MKIAVRYSDATADSIRTVVVDISDETRPDEDAYWDAACDALDELEIISKWHRVEGVVKISPIQY
jgi:hypothetical protein